MRDDQTASADDSVLIKRVAEGDREAFSELYSRYHQRLFAYLTKMLSRNREEVEDLVVDCMFTVWQDAKKFKASSRLSTWIFGIAHNKALNLLRKRGVAMVLELEEAEAMPNSRTDPQQEALNSSVRERIASALERLSPEHREVIELTFYHGFSYNEIAVIVGCPAGTVKTRMFHARRYMKETLTEMGIEGSV